MKYAMKIALFILFMLLLIIVSYSFNIESFTTTDSIIPLHIYQTWHTLELPPKMQENLNKFKKDNPEFEHHLYDDDMCREFIKNNFDKNVLNAFDTLIPGAYKADLWRYCALYINGGIYLDIKFKCENGFKLIDLTDKEYFVLEKPFDLRSNTNLNENNFVDFMTTSDYLNNFEKHIDKTYWRESNFGIYNGLIACIPKNHILLDSINQIVQNVGKKYYGLIDISVSGPIILGKFYFKQHAKNYNSFDIGYGLNNSSLVHFKKKQIILSKYNDYYSEMTTTSKIKPYSELWSSKSIYTTH